MSHGKQAQNQISKEVEALLDGVPSEKHHAVLKCLNARVRHFGKGDLIASKTMADDTIRYLVDGAAIVDHYDEEGTRTIIGLCRAGATVGSSVTPFYFNGEEVTVRAAKPCTTIDFRFDSEIETCPCCARYLVRVKSNLMTSMAQANTQLLKRLDVLSRRTARKRISAFLRDQAEETGSLSFSIPYSRQELADYLCIERSALSRELGNMQRDGLIRFEKNAFAILKRE